jgi:hypothetical protein
MELQVEACMKEEDEVAAATITQALSARARTLRAKRASLVNETFEMLMFMKGNKRNITIFLLIFFKSLINAFISFFWCLLSLLTNEFGGR